MGRLYDRQRWQRVRALQLREFPLCALHLLLGRAVPAVDVDHIKPLKDGGEPFDRDNLRSLCHACHSSVTSAAKHGRQHEIKGCRTDGMPLDPNHPWNRER
ncbi:MAG: hypothetical protein A3G81_26010 [Betaproteobacteria bacterium RIFCSPLOWO2_12_FULL_65_14]|nr:MAG: hypothetical protein A3G81_26010 [Betaproteobacteria bacterium RIFCSPLOWO2_12_FULL_65_14]